MEAPTNSQDDATEETKVSMTVALKQLQDSVVLQGLGDTFAFQEACQHHASIVARESNPLWFLNFAKNDIAAAARRMVNYWQERKQAFGERAFLPMTLMASSDDGSALSPLDVQTLKAGHWLHLPRDQHDRTVLCHDLSKQPQTSTSHDDADDDESAEDSLSFVRIIFFMLQIAMESEASRSSSATDDSGFVLLVNVSNPFAACFDEAFAKAIRQFMSQAMPVKISHIHFICNYPSPFNNNDTDQKAFVESTLGMAQKRLGSLLDENLSTQIVAHSNPECLEKLVALGLTKEGLPACLGGSFSSSQWEPWCRRYCPEEEGAMMVVHEETLELEANLPCLVRNTLWSYSATTRAQSATDVVTADIVSSEDAIPPTTENKKRIATKKPTVQGPGNADSHKKRKALVKSHNTDSTGGDGEDEDPRIKKRRMDAVYAQRKREKLRIETEVLEGQCQEASAINNALLAENQRLEGLVHAAKQLADLYETSTILNVSASAPTFGGGGAAYPSAWQQPYLPLPHQDFRMHASPLGPFPSPQQQLLLAQQQDAYHMRGFAPSGSMLR